MFYFINGTLALLKPSLAVVSAGGVGFKLTISDNTHAALAGKEKTEVRLFTHLSVREDDMELFGFFTEQELDAFKLLITVSGVGPKAAMAILSAFTPDKFVLAVATEDKKSIAKANGIGPKTAARIILELHDKLSAPAGGTLDAALAGAVPLPKGDGKMNEAQEALAVLGYNRTQILSALGAIDTAHMEVEDIIRAALKKLM